MHPEPTAPKTAPATQTPAPVLPTPVPVAAVPIAPAPDPVAMAVAPAPPPEPVTQHVAVAQEPLPGGPTETMPNKSSELPVLPGPSEENDDISDTPPARNDMSEIPTPKPSVPPQMPPSGPHAPIGIIVATIVGMIVLSGLAIAVYMTSQSSL